MRKMVKKALFVGVFLMVNQVASAQSVQDALQVVKKSVTIVMQDLNANKTRYKKNPSALSQMIDSKALPLFNSRKMARLVLATSWRKASKQQRNDFINEFKQLMMRKYASELLNYTDATFSYGKPTAVKRNRTKIPVTIESRGETYPLLLSMGYSKGKWKAYDATFDGFSLVTSFRSSVGTEVSNKGIDRVIADMREKNKRGVVN